MATDLALVARGVGQALQSDVDDDILALPDEADPRDPAERLGGEAVIERVRIVDRRAVDTDDEVAGLDPRTRGGTVGDKAGDERAARPLQSEAFGDFRRDFLKLCPEPRPLHRGA